MELTEKTIGSYLKERVEQTPDKISIVYDGEEYTWARLMAETKRICAWLIREGITRHDRVALIGKNSFNWISVYYALVSIGAVAVPVSCLYKMQELSFIFKNIEIQHILYDDDGISGQMLKELDRNDFPALKSVNQFGVWMDLKMKEMEDMWYLNTVNPHDTACILFTSGSTSHPKGVMLSHYSLVNNARGMCKVTGWTIKDRICLSVPLFHCFGISAGILASVISGAGIYICGEHKTEAVLQTLERYHCTVFNGVPTMFLAMVYGENYKKYNISSIKSGIIAGSRVSLTEYKKIKNTLQIEHLHISYGQTETSPCITMASGSNMDSDSAGLPLDFIQVRIWDMKKGQESECGTVGLIQTKGYHVMQGYYGCQEETALTIDKNGWLCTGDLGYLDADGELHVIGREKEMIIRGGENIAPAEIEECIRQMEEVADVKVFGKPSLVLQEEIAAGIVLKEGCSITKYDVRKQVKERLADYKVPKYIQFVQEMPVLSSGKADVKQLEEMISQNS